MDRLLRTRQSFMLLTIIIWELLLNSCFCCAAIRTAHPTKVLLVTGDWKSQAWYQDVVMGGKNLYRGRFIASKVNEYAPGKFVFQDITSYVAQQYLDENYLSQFDVVLLGDVCVWSMPDRVIQALRSFVSGGGGLIYCGSYKWHTGLTSFAHLDEILPVKLTPSTCKDDDWKLSGYIAPERNVQPLVIDKNNPITAGLHWEACPPLEQIFRVEPKPNSEILLRSPGGNPVLVAGTLGKGRVLVSTSIFANDDVSTKFCEGWSDIGRFYSQIFQWLGAESQNKIVSCQKHVATIQVEMDGTKPGGTIVAPGVFSVNSAVLPPNLGRLEGVALTNFEKLNLKGGFSRISPLSFERLQGQYNYKRLDESLQEFERLHLQPEIVFDDLIHLPWIWPGGDWTKASPQEIENCCNYVSDLLRHTNHGTGVDQGYQPIVKYIEVCNEPLIDAHTVDAYTKLYRAVADRVHRDFPGVQVGALGAYEVPYAKMFLDAVHGKVDFLSRHPYGWTGEMLFKLQDEIQAYAKQKGYPPQKFFITEWDFWIAGVPKFDYMMRRSFEAVKRDDLIGALHYRLDQYPEPIYNFGMLWAGFGAGAGKRGEPMHDAYDAAWAFRDFRGHRVPVKVTAQDKDQSPSLLHHFLADATVSGEKANVVLYYDHGCEGEGMTDYVNGAQISTINAKVVMNVAPSHRKRAVKIGYANGENFSEDQKSISVAPDAQQVALQVELKPHSAATISLE